MTQVDYIVRLRFQSTLPQGERLYCPLAEDYYDDFNPRSHKGSDSSLYTRYPIPVYFNPRSHKGSDFFAVSAMLIPSDFNPRSHKGSDVVRVVLAEMDMRFQSTLPQGERRRLYCAERIRNRISIHAPTRGATCQFPYQQ